MQNIVLRATTLQERIASYLAGEKFEKVAASQERHRQWEKHFSPAGEAAFRHRIAALGLSPADLPQVLGMSSVHRRASLPDWAELLGAILEEILASNPCETVNPSAREDAGEVAAFLSLYESVVRCASQRLYAAAADHSIHFTDEARAGMEAHLSGRLMRAGRQIIQFQFAVFQTVGQFEFPRAEVSQSNRTAASPQEFVGPVPGKRLFQLFEEYPVHARHCATLALNWVRAANLFLSHLGQDYAGLCERLSAGKELGRITELRAGLSDPHDGGHTVLALTFASGASIVYKPRSLATEQQFAGMLKCLGESGSYKSPSTWDRGDHGWVEFVPVSPCRDLAAVQRFYWRAGALMGLVHLARGVDCHQENLIAWGEYPTLVDLDALWHPQNPRQPPASELHRLGLPQMDSVARTGFLPGGSYAFSALEGDLSPEKGGFSSRRAGQFHETAHLPRIASTVLRAHNFIEEISAGFQHTGEIFLKDENGRTRLVEWLGRLVHCPRRRIHRSSSFYAKWLERACSPWFLKERVDLDLALETLVADEPEVGVGTREIDSLGQLEVPYFCQSASTEIAPSVSRLPSLASYLRELSVIRSSLCRDDNPGHQGTTVQ